MEEPHRFLCFTFHGVLVVYESVSNRNESTEPFYKYKDESVRIIIVMVIPSHPFACKPILSANGFSNKCFSRTIVDVISVFFK